MVPRLRRVRGLRGMVGLVGDEELLSEALKELLLQGTGCPAAERFQNLEATQKSPKVQLRWWNRDL